MKTGIKFKPCNVGTAEAHNRRDRAYCEAVTRKYGHTYFWDDRRHLNASWRNPAYPKPLPELLDELKVLVKQKTGRAMQCKDVEYTDRKSGKKKKRSGCSAIREGCPPIKPDTKIEDFEPFVRWLEGFGISVISIDLHHDEGHADLVTDDLLPNHHAHIIVDWVNHETGKTVKIDNEVCKQMQTVLAESLGMERGTPKEDTGIEGLGCIEYKEKMAAAHLRQLTEQCAEKERRNEQLDTEAIDRCQEIAELEERREAKRKAIDEENGSAVREGLANLFGKGKFAETEKERKRLAEENTELKKKMAQVPAVVERQVQRMVTERTAAYEIESKRQRSEIARLRGDNNAMHSKVADFSNRVTFLERKHDELYARFQKMLRMMSEAFRRAVEALVSFAKAKLLRDFTDDHLRDIVGFVKSAQNVGDAINSLKIFSRPLLDDREYSRATGKLDELNTDFDRYEERYKEIAEPRRGGGLRR